jgi:flagellar biosynthetic protein FlhB
LAGEKTEQASSKKREDERKKGHIFQSQDIVTSASLIGFFYLLSIMGTTFGKQITEGMQSLLRNMPVYISGESDMKNRFITVITVCAEVLIPIMVVAIAISFIATMVQTRLLVSFNQMKPDFSRMSPLQGMKRLFSIKSLVELLKAIVKISAIGLVIFFELRTRMNNILLLFDMSLGGAFIWTVQMILDIGFKASIAMLIIGLGDYFYQWWSFERDIRMSKEEIKDEYKQTEGNPETKSRIKGAQRKMAKARMMQAVPEADVVIKNPTHFAVALKYDKDGKGAPVCVAKGQDNIALKIIEIANEHKVFVTENIPLARALFKAVEVGDEIPAEFYKAVAEVLAYIYRLKRAGRV